MWQNIISIVYLYVLTKKHDTRHLKHSVRSFCWSFLDEEKKKDVVNQTEMYQYMAVIIEHFSTVQSLYRHSWPQMMDPNYFYVALTFAHVPLWRQDFLFYSAKARKLLGGWP